MFECVNCNTVGDLTRHGRCSSCGSDVVLEPYEPDPVRYSEPRLLTGIECMEAGL